MKSTLKSEVIEGKDITLPEIKMLTPRIENRSLFTTSEPELLLIGKVTDPGGISTLLMDAKSLKIWFYYEFSGKI